MELYELRAVLEGYAARQAARRATREDVDYLAANAERFSECRKRGNLQGCEQANIEFHDKIIALAGNDLLQGMMERFNIIRQAFRITRGLQWDEHELNTPYPHEALVELIRRRRRGRVRGLHASAHSTSQRHTCFKKPWGLVSRCTTNGVRTKAISRTNL